MTYVNFCGTTSSAFGTNSNSDIMDAYYNMMPEDDYSSLNSEDQNSATSSDYSSVDYEYVDENNLETYSTYGYGMVLYPHTTFLRFEIKGIKVFDSRYQLYSISDESPVYSVNMDECEGNSGPRAYMELTKNDSIYDAND